MHALPDANAARDTAQGKNCVELVGTGVAARRRMTPFHAAVWIDHHDAKVFHVEPERFDESLIHAPKANLRRDPAAAERFYHEVAAALETAGEILIVGPGSAKLELVKHVHKHHPRLVEKIVGIETVDHPTDRQLVSYVRKYFHAADRMRGLVP